MKLFFKTSHSKYFQAFVLILAFITIPLFETVKAHPTTERSRSVGISFLLFRKLGEAYYYDKQYDKGIGVLPKSSENLKFPQSQNLQKNTSLAQRNWLSPTSCIL